MAMQQQQLDKHTDLVRDQSQTMNSALTETRKYEEDNKALLQNIAAMTAAGKLAETDLAALKSETLAQNIQLKALEASSGQSFGSSSAAARVSHQGALYIQYV